MAYVITGRCLGERYGACVPVCPCECMRWGDADGAPMMVIDPTCCIDCGACLPECPVDAIVDGEDREPAWTDYNRAAAELWPTAHGTEAEWGPRDAAEPPRSARP